VSCSGTPRHWARRRSPGIEPATFLLPDNRSYLLSYCRAHYKDTLQVSARGPKRVRQQYIADGAVTFKCSGSISTATVSFPCLLCIHPTSSLKFHQSPSPPSWHLVDQRFKNNRTNRCRSYCLSCRIRLTVLTKMAACKCVTSPASLPWERSRAVPGTSSVQRLHRFHEQWMNHELSTLLSDSVRIVILNGEISASFV